MAGNSSVVPARSAQRRRTVTKAEQNALGMALFGPRLLDLPWSTHSAALQALDIPVRRRVLEAERLLSDGWLSDPAESLIRAMRLIGRGVVIVHSGARGKWPSWMIHDYLGKPSFDGDQIVGNKDADFGAARRYVIDGPDPFAHRPVNIPTLVENLEGVQPLFELLATCNLHHQLRTVLYDEQPTLIGYFGLYLPEKEHSYSLDEHAALHAITPALDAWIRTARAIGIEPLPDTGLTAALDANERPCFLIRDDGATVFANSAGRRIPMTTERREKLRRMSRSAMRLPLSGAALRLVMLKAEPVRGGVLGLNDLPSSLARVARELAKGSSDKDIARDLDMPLATVRTYTQRALARLGCTSRRELIQRSGWDFSSDE